MDTRTVNRAFVRGKCADLFGVQRRANRRSVATCYLVCVLDIGHLFRYKTVVGGGDSELYFVLRRVADTRLAIGARKFSSSVQTVFRLRCPFFPRKTRFKSGGTAGVFRNVKAVLTHHVQ